MEKVNLFRAVFCFEKFSLLVSDMDARIAECQALSELAELESTRRLTDQERWSVFEKGPAIFLRLSTRRGANLMEDKNILQLHELNKLVAEARKRVE